MRWNSNRVPFPSNSSRYTVRECSEHGRLRPLNPLKLLVRHLLVLLVIVLELIEEELVDVELDEEELVVAYSDEKLEIGFNAKYLLEIASQVDRENAVFLFNSSGDPTLMREGSDDSAVYVVMPMRV